MKAAVLIRPKEFQIEDRPIPTYSEDEILVHIDGVGICGSDLHFYSDFHIGSARIEGTRILGHEVCGTVVKTGKNVTGFHPGDHVALDPTRGCGQCEYCRSGRENLCEKGSPKFLGNAYTDGAMQEYFVSTETRTFLLPKDCPVERACLLEPFSVALHAVWSAMEEFGNTALVLGAGCIGLMTVLALQERGIKDIVVVDLVEARLAKAKELGAAVTINAKEKNTEDEIAALTNGKGIDLVFETAGSSFTQQQSVRLLKKGGRIVMVGMSSAESIAIDLNTLLRKEGKIFTVFRFTTEFSKAAGMIQRRDIPLEKVVSNIYSLEEVQKAFEDSINHKEEIIKAVIRI